MIGFVRLQKIDNYLDRANARLKEIKSILENDQAIKQISTEKSIFEKKVITTQEIVQLAEQAVENQQIKLQQNEANLYSGALKNPKELQELQLEISSIKRTISTLENKLLESMIMLEKDEDDYKRICIHYESTMIEFKTINSKYIEEMRSLQNELGRLSIEKKAAENTLSTPDISFYNQLRQHRGGIAVSSISEGACDSCGTTLTPAQEQSIRSSDRVINCPSCGRILYSS